MSGHGWVTPNASGAKARCGGPAICAECAIEAAQSRTKEKRVIKPTVGRIVWFRPGQYDNLRTEEGAYLAAIVCHVWCDTCVNLTVFDQNGNTHSRSSVCLAQEGDAVPAGIACAEWMPYQKEQATKQQLADLCTKAENYIRTGQ